MSQITRNKKDQEHSLRIRQQQRKLLEELDQDQLNDSNQIDKTRALLLKANAVFKDVKESQEAALDSLLMVKFAALAKAQNAHLDASLLSFTSTSLLEALKKRLKAKRRASVDEDDDDDTSTQSRRAAKKAPALIDWKRVGEMAFRYMRPAPQFSPMLGPLAMDTKKRVIQRQARSKNKEPDGPIVRPDTKANQQDDKDPTTARIEEVMELLDDHLDRLDVDDCCFFEFAFNPQSFSQTVENVFYISFMVKDGMIAVCYDENGLPRLKLGEKALEPEDEDEKDGEDAPQETTLKQQMMFKLDMQIWREVVEAFQIKRSIIPNRKPTMKK
eukprot:TRINITY_DN6127_c0_g2_i2.p1 TRINITY_DN6127_c0_g2~~TRINITY_DN6127_c0_g2_i2.p1  ORF type:complete len:329 (+),score=75.11 TRINITY_DN6127_c0_g2_i2:70-1056(+)